MKTLTWNNNSIEKKDKPYPEIKDSRDAIVKVTLSSICTSDLHIKHGFIPQAKQGITLGHEFVGEIVELGKDVKNFNIGDRVVCANSAPCGECFYCKREEYNLCENLDLLNVNALKIKELYLERCIINNFKAISKFVDLEFVNILGTDINSDELLCFVNLDKLNTLFVGEEYVDDEVISSLKEKGIDVKYNVDELLLESEEI